MRLAPLAKFDEKDFDLPMVPYEAKHKVKLFKALLIFFSTVIMVRSVVKLKPCDYLNKYLGLNENFCNFTEIPYF